MGDLMIIGEAKQTSAITGIQYFTVNANEDRLVSFYTESGTALVNGVFASCKSENDGSEYFIPSLAFIAKYMSPTIS